MRTLEPTLVWTHFADLCDQPRPSKQEEAARRSVEAWARRLGLSAEVDAAGNLLVKKPASPGREDRPGVILQGHLDMVGQADAQFPHDFTKDPIRPVVRDGWVVAERTTLGADNGIGVALIMAALEDDTLAHPPLEALFTIDEEMGMGGAHGLAPGLLQGTRMLNLDSEEWGEVFIGCAGGCDVSARLETSLVAVPAGYVGRRIDLSGLQGGHSGIDIHRGRGNANKLLVWLLRELAELTDLCLSELSGGTARNALPRSATALVALPELDLAAFEALLADFQSELRQELSGADDGVRVTARPAEVEAVLDGKTQGVLLAALNAAPFGVRRMSLDCPGVVETSNNLGIIELKDGRFSTDLMVRSLRDGATVALAREVADLFALAGCDVGVSGTYPGWTPNPASPLLADCLRVFRREFDGDARIQVIHAGLECGVIAAKYPGIDAISFGPNIRGAHAPGERVEIASVERSWRLLRALLADL